jgi:O-antigen/teichoic acid export membrane protein
LIIIQQGSAILNVTITVILSIYYQTIWPLVIGLTVENFCTCLFSFILLPFRPRFKVEKFYLKEIFEFARRMFGLPVLASIFFQFDIFIIGRLLNMEQLGLYSMARTLALVPVTAFSKTIRPIVLPAFSKLQNSKESLVRWLLNITDLVVLVCLPLIALSIIISEPLLSLLFGPKYGTVSISFSILMLYVFVRLISTIIMQLFFSLGRPDLQRRFALVRVIIVMVLAYPATKAFGLVGASSTVLIAMLSLFVLQVKWAIKLIDMKFTAYLMCLGRGLAFSSIVIFPGITLRIIFQETNLNMIFFGIILCFIAWGLAARTSYYKTIIFGELS